MIPSGWVNRLINCLASATPQPVELAETSVGLAWYRREDWATLRDLFPERSALHATYEWEADARRVERQLGAQGLAVERIIIDPAEFSGTSYDQSG